MPDFLNDTRLSNAGEGPAPLRIWPFVLVIVVVFTTFVMRLFQLQILEFEDAVSQKVANYVRTVRLEAQRGELVDREGRTIAASRPAYGVDLIPHEIRTSWRVYSVLGAVLGRDPTELASRVGQPVGRRRFQPVPLSRDLSHEEWARLAAHRYALPGVELHQKPLRDYVYQEMAAQLLGTIGEVNPHELQTPAFEDYRSGETIGKTGLEARYEAHLRGKAGGVNLIVDVAGREIDEIDRIEPTPGGRLVLTLDLDLQQAAEAAFRSTDPEQPDPMGALVALDPGNGDVLAMVSAPAYDANAFAGGIDSESWQSLSHDEWRPLRNRAIAGVYPPGSTYKAIAAAAGLAEGIIDETTIVPCPGYYRLGRRIYRCWKREGHGPVDLGEALMSSCDVYFYELGRKLGVETLARYARRFGLGSPTGIGIGGEVGGLVPTPEWKQRTRGERWIEGETISVSIGQGANLTTPLQLAVAYAVIANGGDLIEPRLVLRRETWDGELLEEIPPRVRERGVIAPAILEQVRRGLTRVVMEASGTGRRAQVPGVSVGGKSGTTQVVSLDLVEGLEPEEIPIRYRDHALFVAFAPSDAPEIVVAAIVEHASGGGGAVAAPIVQKVLARYFEKERSNLVPTSLAVAPGTPSMERAR